MYRKHRTAFVTSALYADSQAIVKNIIIAITRMQTLDHLNTTSSSKGLTDSKGVFSYVRSTSTESTQDHARNFEDPRTHFLI